MTIKYTFGNYTEVYHYDWTDVDGSGIDAPAYLLTGILSGGDFQRNKQIIYQTTHFKRTEVTPIVESLSSKTYAIYFDDAITAASDPVTGERHLVLASLPPVLDLTTASMSAVSGKLKSSDVKTTVPPEDATVSMIALDGTLKTQLVKFTVPTESSTASAIAVSGELKAQLIRYTIPTESTTASMIAVSGVLANG